MHARTTPTRIVTLLATTLVLATALGTAASLPTTPADTLTWAVEGHTVHRSITVGDAPRVSGDGVHPGPVPAAVLGEGTSGDVHWFDDAFTHRGSSNPVEAALVVVHATELIVGPDGSTEEVPVCSGTTWAAPPTVDVEDVALEDLTAVASYHVEGPNLVTWVTTELETSTGEPLWAVSATCEGAWAWRTAELTSRDDSTAPDVDPLEYNAALWLPTKDLVPTGSVGFGAGGLDAGRSTVDGNAHAYNPADDTAAELHSHPTVDLRIAHRTDVTSLPYAPVTFVNDADYGCWHDHDGDGCT